jgi:flagellar basal-body rod modification protein FlgD
MAVTSATSQLPATSTAGSSAIKQLSGNFSTFLTLLTTQLQNQDPLSPMDSNQFTQQLVQYSQVEQQISSNENLKTLIAQSQSQGGVMAASYLGKKVTVTDGRAPLSNGAATWDYTLKNQAAKSVLAVTNAAGQIVYTGTAESGAGAHRFAWDGKSTGGQKLPDGVYTLNVYAKAQDGSDVITAVSSTGTVGEIDMTSGTPQLKIGSMSIGLSQIANVQN